jgi:hypothetical protein
LARNDFLLVNDFHFDKLSVRPFRLGVLLFLPVIGLFSKGWRAHILSVGSLRLLAGNQICDCQIAALLALVEFIEVIDRRWRSLRGVRPTAFFLPTPSAPSTSARTPPFSISARALSTVSGGLFLTPLPVGPSLLLPGFWRPAGCMLALPAAIFSRVAFFPLATVSRFTFRRRPFACVFPRRRLPAALALTH